MRESCRIKERVNAREGTLSSTEEALVQQEAEEEEHFFALHQNQMQYYGKNANDEENEGAMTLVERFRKAWYMGERKFQDDDEELENVQVCSSGQEINGSM